MNLTISLRDFFCPGFCLSGDIKSESYFRFNVRYRCHSNGVIRIIYLWCQINFRLVGGLGAFLLLSVDVLDRISSSLRSALLLLSPS